MKIYIAGKVTGENQLECAAKFGQAQEHITKKGHEAINPLQVVGDWTTPWHVAMRKCIAALMQCDAIYLLPDAVDSPGARKEAALAHELQLQVYTSLPEIVHTGKDPCSHPPGWSFTEVVHAAVGCETTVERCYLCNSIIEEPKTDC